MSDAFSAVNKTEIGSIPEGWTVVSVEDIANKPQYGYTASATDNDTGIKFLRITDITGQGVLWSSVPFAEIPSDKLERYLVRRDDIVFARTGATTGKSFLIGDCPKAVFASYLIRLQVNENAVPAFVYYYSTFAVT